MRPPLARASWRRSRLCASSRCALSAARLAVAPETPARWVSIVALAASTLASASARLARACSRLARCEASCASYILGSSCATNCPLCTTVLKSANKSEIVPETWLPTCTVVTACSVPVADTVLRMEPRSIFAVMYSSDVAPRFHRKYPPIPPTRMTPIAVIMICFLLSLSFMSFCFSLFIFLVISAFIYQQPPTKNQLISHRRKNSPSKSPTDLKTPRRLVWLRLSEIKEREIHFPFPVCDLTFVIDQCPRSDLGYGADVNITISDATPRQTPKGSGVLNPFLLRYIKIAPTIAPMVEPR